MDDIQIILLTAERKAYIITEDKDFGDEIVFHKVANIGAMLLRLGGMNIEEKISNVIIAIENHSEELLNAFSLLSKKKLRIRKFN